MTDSAVRRRLCEEGPGALAEAFSEHRQRLARMVSFRLDPILAGRVDVDDVLQEAWIAAAERVPHFLENESLTLFVWLRLIVMQTLTDVQRRHLGAKMRDVFREASLNRAAVSGNTSISLVAKLMGTFTSPSHAAVRNETAQRLREALDSMDEIDREVLALRHFEELSNSEVAGVLGIQQKAASIRYVRALRRLKAILADFPGFAERTS
jgi:RNA polymerase sigma-70 factor (ECF subfamily)